MKNQFFFDFLTRFLEANRPAILSWIVETLLQKIPLPVGDDGRISFSCMRDDGVTYPITVDLNDGVVEDEGEMKPERVQYGLRVTVSSPTIERLEEVA